MLQNLGLETARRKHEMHLLRCPEVPPSLPRWLWSQSHAPQREAPESSRSTMSDKCHIKIVGKPQQTHETAGPIAKKLGAFCQFCHVPFCWTKCILESLTIATEDYNWMPRVAKNTVCIGAILLRSC